VNAYLELTVMIAGSVCLTAGVAWLTLSMSPGRSLRRAVMVPPVAGVAAVVLSVLVATWRMVLSAHDAQVVVLTCTGAGAVSALLAAVLAHRIREEELVAAHARAEHDRVVTEQTRRDEVDAARRKLVAGLSHDLRTPLAGLRAMAEALEDGVAEDPPRYHRQMRLEVDRLADMVTDLFEVSRLQAGLIPSTPERMALADLIEEAVVMIQPLARQHGVQIEAHSTGHVPVEIDARALTRAVDNLLTNAVRHTPHDGTVAIVAGRDEAGNGLVSVTDRCGGIPEKDLANLFDLGWQGDTARTPGPDAGAGLGLAIVRGIVEAHGGLVSVHNLDGGCRFDLRIPAVD
jgi:signal transduction histidine kinase